MLAVEQLQTGYTMRAAARIAGMNEKQIYAYAKDGRLKTYTGVDGKMMVSREELIYFLRTYYD